MIRAREQVEHRHLIGLAEGVGATEPPLEIHAQLAGRGPKRFGPQLLLELAPHGRQGVEVVLLLGGVDEDHAHDLLRVAAAKRPSPQAAERRPDQDAGRRLAGGREQRVQIVGAVLERSPRGPRVAPPQTGAIVGGSGGDPRDLFLDVEPVQIGGRNPRFKQHCDVARSLFQQVEPASVSNIDPPSSAGIAQPVIMRADPLIQKPGRRQGR